jgi:hypothetical protein
MRGRLYDDSQDALEGFYNRPPRHSKLRHLSPAEIEQGAAQSTSVSTKPEEVHTPHVDDGRSSSIGLPSYGSGIVKRIPPITSPALKSLFGLLTCPL